MQGLKTCDAEVRDGYPARQTLQGYKKGLNELGGWGSIDRVPQWNAKREWKGEMRQLDEAVICVDPTDRTTGTHKTHEPHNDTTPCSAGNN
jgi:hypothetical protein